MPLSPWTVMQITLFGPNMMEDQHKDQIKKYAKTLVRNFLIGSVAGVVLNLQVEHLDFLAEKDPWNKLRKMAFPNQIHDKTTGIPPSESNLYEFLL